MSLIGSLIVEIQANTAKLDSAISHSQTRMRAFDRVVKDVKYSLMGFAGIFGARMAFDWLTDGTIKFQAIQYAVESATGSWREADAQMKFVERTAQSLGLHVDDLGQRYAQLNAMTQGTVLEGEKTKQLFTGLATAFRVLHTPSMQVTRTFNAIIEMMGTTNLQTRFLTQQFSRDFPLGLKAAADAMGLTVGKMEDMARQGKLLTSTFLEALTRGTLKRYADSAKDAADGIQAAMARVHNASLLLAAGIGESGQGTALTSMINGIAKALDYLTNHLQAVSALINGVVAVGFAYLLRAIIPVRAILMSLNTQTLAYQFTLARMAGVSRIAAAGLLTMDAALASMKSIMAVLGGPLGVILLAATALYQWAHNADISTEQAKRLGDGLDDLKQKFLAANQVQRQGMIAQLNIDLAKAREAIIQTEAQLDDLQIKAKNGLTGSFINLVGTGDVKTFIHDLGSSGSSDKLKLLEAKLDTLQSTMRALAKQREELLKAFNKPIKPIDHPGGSDTDAKMADLKKSLLATEAAEHVSYQKRLKFELDYWNKKLATLKQGTELYAQVYKQAQDLQKRMDEQTRQLDLTGIESTRQAALAKLAFVRETLKQQLALHKITNAQEIQAEIQLENRRYEIERQALEDRLKLYQSDVNERARIQAQLDQLASDHQLKLKELQDQSERTSSSMTQYMVQAARSMQSTLADFFASSHQGFQGFLVDFLNVIRRMLAEWAAAQAIMAAGQALSKQGGFWGSLGNALLSAGGGGKAQGGDVYPGMSYMVGETGPERFTPSTPGTITPNSQISQQSGSTSLTVNVDARGAMSPGQVAQMVSEGVRIAVGKSVFYQKHGYPA